MDLLQASAGLSVETSPLLFFAMFFQPERDVPLGSTEAWRRSGPSQVFTLRGLFAGKHRAICSFPGTSELF